MVTELMTPLIPGAGPPPTSKANLPGIAAGVMAFTSLTEWAESGSFIVSLSLWDHPPATNG